ncbi:urotensin 2 domain containing [Engraulis encrasicolus]|uniref:urotensin 2 domain containing n=1 Tax=Engraulis encrasicolus TaxID=184585 RepID=UPI002FD57536
MDGMVFANVLLGVLLIAALHGVNPVQTRTLLPSENNILHFRAGADIQSEILALLLRQRLQPVSRKMPLDIEILGKEEDLEKLQRQIMPSTDEKEHRKREEACFWKYCV